MHVIGIVGGVASGKSWVAQQLARLGAEVLDADRAGHEVLTYPEIKQAIRDRFGSAVFDGQGNVDRRALARIVFAPPPDGPRELEFLEQLTHPSIGSRLIEQAADIGAGGDVPAVVLDAPVLVEAGWNEYCNKIVFVDAPRDVRLRRALARGWTEKEFDARERAQHSLESKRGMADVIIDNSQSAEGTAEQVEQFWRSLVG